MRTPYEFSRPFEIAELTSLEAPFAIAATAHERAALCRRLDLLALDRLEAEGTVSAGAGGVVRVRGRLRAHATQRCVVTLEPVPAELEVPFERTFVRGSSAARLLHLDLEQLDLEPLVGDILDLGEVVTEELALALDPYPRAAGAEETLREFGVRGDDEPEAERESPFSVLRGRFRGGT
ncbi:hypothetical protein HRbin39_00817 [bacterium HR39]|nr:hypothetical protein HRbin39_00817 [bacterium HR39]